MISCAELLGPVRFDGWDAKGDPVGKPVTSPLVRCFATAEGQASQTYDTAAYMLRNGTVFDEYEVDVGLTRTFTTDGGELVAQTSAASSKEGGKDTFDVFDESHLLVLPQHKKLHATVTRNLLKRAAADGWSLETSTMFAPGEDSVAEETYKTAHKIESVLFDHKQAPLDTDITDDVALRKALCEVYGPAASWMDIDGLVAMFRDPQNRESDNRRYWLNQPWTTEDKFTTPNAWDALADPSRNPEDGARIVLALDGSYNNDSTAVIGITVEEKPHVFVVGAWERTPASPVDWEVDILDVMETIRQARVKYTVAELTADPYRWSLPLQQMEDEGCVVSRFPQTADRMTPGTSRFNDLIATGGMTQDADPRLRRHVLNAIYRDDARGKRLMKDKKGSANKIDLAVAALLGLARAGALMSEPEEFSHVYFPSDFIDAQAEQAEQAEQVADADFAHVYGRPQTSAEKPVVGWLSQQMAMAGREQQ